MPGAMRVKRLQKLEDRQTMHKEVVRAQQGADALAAELDTRRFSLTPVPHPGIIYRGHRKWTVEPDAVS